MIAVYILAATASGLATIIASDLSVWGFAASPFVASGVVLIIAIGQALRELAQTADRSRSLADKAEAVMRRDQLEKVAVIMAERELKRRKPVIEGSYSIVN